MMLSDTFDELADGYEDEFSPRVADLQPFLDDEVRQRKLDRALKDYAEAEESGDTRALEQAANNLRGTLDALDETLPDELDSDHDPWQDGGLNKYGRILTDDEREEVNPPADPVLITADTERPIIAYGDSNVFCGRPGRFKTTKAVRVALEATHLDVPGRLGMLNYEEPHMQGIARFMDLVERVDPNPQWHLIQPIAPNTFESPDDIHEVRKLLIDGLLKAPDPKRSIVVLDSIARAKGALSDNNEFTEWYDEHVQPFKDAGITVIATAFVPKTEPEKGPLGSTGITGAFDMVQRMVRIDGHVMPTSERTGAVGSLHIKDRFSRTGTGEGDVIDVMHVAPTEDGRSDITFTEASTRTGQAARQQASKPKPKQRDIEQDVLALLVEQDGHEWDGGFEALRQALKPCGAGPLRKALGRLKAAKQIGIKATPGGPTRYWLTA